MELNKGHMIFWAVCLIAGIVFGAGFRSCGNPAEPVPADPVVIHDTVTVTDTLRIKGKTKTLEVHDTVWLVKPDSNGIDTIKPLVNETKLYRDTFTTDSTMAEVAVLFSGYNARIDSIGINYQATIQPVVCEKESGWGWSITVGPYVGYGVTINNGRVLAGPKIGLGVQLGIGYQKKFKSLKRR